MTASCTEQSSVVLAKLPPDTLKCAALWRWFPADKVQASKAKFLDLILYSREQLVKEHEAMPGKGPSDHLPDAPWGIISIKPQVLEDSGHC